MYTVIDNRKRENRTTFNNVEIGDFFCGQIFDGSFNESEEQFCLKVDEENYFCLSVAYNCLLCYNNYPVSITEIFNEDNKK